MFLVLLRFSNRKSQASEFMEDHKEWIRRGFDDGVFLLTGSLRPDGGGGILADRVTLEQLQTRVAEDPFVAEDVVTAEIIEIVPSRTDQRLDFLLEPTAAPASRHRPPQEPAD